MSEISPKDFQPPFDWSDVVVMVAILLVLILFGGEPDLMDAIVERIRSGS